MTGGNWFSTFNSLFEIPGAWRRVRARELYFQFSFWDSPRLKSARGQGCNRFQFSFWDSVSSSSPGSSLIIKGFQFSFWDSAAWGLLLLRDVTQTFNSLFEVREIASQLERMNKNLAFNSLFEVQAVQQVRTWIRARLSILFLRFRAVFPAFRP